MLLSLAGPSPAEAVTCPNPVPVVNENQCSGPGTTAWRLSNHDPNVVAGFATRQSVGRGQDVVLKIARNGGSGTKVDISVYRIGYYGGTGGRLVHTKTGVTITNSYGCGAPDGTTGKVDCADWDPTYTIPGSSLPASGVYLVRVKTTDTQNDTHIIFTVRDDARAAPILFDLPTATYQAYNRWGDKSLYTFNSQGVNTISGTTRAVKVSFQRPFEDVRAGDNWFMKADYALVYWMERQGYDVSYTEDVAVHASPAELKRHETVVVSGHSEYWSAETLRGYKEARDAGVNIASFSANTAYWKVRYEDGNDTLACYKTVQGNGTASGGGATPNDWGPDGVQNTADDALGLDRKAGTADDKPQNSTTTFRDNGAPPGDPSAPAGGRVGPDEPENSLFGVMYYGDNDSVNYQLRIPAGNGAGEFAADRTWRRTGIATGADTVIASKQVGWEWDAIPTQPQYLSRQPAGVKQLTETDTTNLNPNWLQDEGRLYAHNPPLGQPGVVQAVKYRATRSKEA